MRLARFGLKAVVLAIAVATIWLCRAIPLEQSAKLLIDSSMPIVADLVIVMRGDESSFERAQAGARLLRDGFASRIYVSSALDDLASTRLRTKGINIASPQQRIVSILRQNGILCDAVIVDLAPPGVG